MSLLLNFLIFGQNPEKEFFSIEIPKKRPISILKDLIKEKTAPEFDNIYSKDLCVWKVSLPFGNTLQAAVAEIDLSDESKVVLAQSVEQLFPEVPSLHLHLIVKAPNLHLKCLLEDAPQDEAFTVQIPKNSTVAVLQQRIKDASSKLEDIEPMQLTLWKASIDTPSKIPPGPPLERSRSLSTVFRRPLNKDLIHVFVRWQKPGGSTYQLLQAREKFYQDRKSVDPSVEGQPTHFSASQNEVDTHIQCNRPNGYPRALPLSVLHPVFGEFTDHAENLVPTLEDVAFFRSFVRDMPDICENYDRQSIVAEAFGRVGMSLDFAGLDEFYRSIGGFKTLVVHVKDEIGSLESESEPYFHSILLYLKATQEIATLRLNSVLPCILMLVFGPYVTFAGAAWTDRPTVQMLSPVIPCHYHHTDLKMESMLLRHLGALRRAIQSLEVYYKDCDADPSVPLRDPSYPYPTSFKAFDGSLKEFRYISKVDTPAQGDLFFGQCIDDAMAICIKFVPRYCKEGHEFLAADQLAPTLYAVERLPGGMYMVIMDDISKECVSLATLLSDWSDYCHWMSDEHSDSRKALFQNVRRCLQKFHEAGFVHGDIRDTNIMVRSQDLGGFADGLFMLVDFDFCGQNEQVYYPLDLNTRDFFRPKYATGGAVIKAEHDLEMLDHIWDL